MKVLLVAKAPVPGRVKTRLGARIGDDQAAVLAAAALLDTIDACRSAGAEGHLSLAGALSDSVQGEEISAALEGWTISPQRGNTAAALIAVADGLAQHDAVLGPAVDGGWWALARQDPNAVRHVAEVAMSRDTTFVDTQRALERAGCRVGHAAPMTDVDTVADADADADLVATISSHLRFAHAWRSVCSGVSR